MSQLAHSTGSRAFSFFNSIEINKSAIKQTLSPRIESRSVSEWSKFHESRAEKLAKCFEHPIHSQRESCRIERPLLSQSYFFFYILFEVFYAIYKYIYVSSTTPPLHRSGQRCVKLRKIFMGIVSLFNFDILMALKTPVSYDLL